MIQFPPWTSGIALVLFLSVAACSRDAHQPNDSLEQSIKVPDYSASSVGAHPLSSDIHDRVIASLPDAAGRITSVRVKRYANGVRQDVLFDDSAIKGARNSLTLLARTSQQSTLDESVPLYPPTESAIRSEIGAQFPHVAMQIVERESSNRYGPYGLALGRVGADLHCLYMWQWIDANHLPQDAGVNGPLSIRIRLCQAATTFDAMASLLNGLTIGGPNARTVVASTDERHTTSLPNAADTASSTVEAPRKVARHSAHTKNSSDRDASAHLRPVKKLQLVSSKPPINISTDLPPQAFLGPKASAKTSSDATSMRSY
jgi:Cellulose biosynthesis protein BcsN